MRAVSKLATVAYFAFALSAVNARSDDRRLDKPDLNTQPLPKTNPGESCAFQQDGSIQCRAKLQQTKKRGRLHSWLDMAAKARDRQPDWLSPLATTSGRLKQEFRYDVWDQPSAGDNRTYQFGGGKGLELITSSRTQILVGVPPYTLQSPNGPAGGVGDLPLMLKFRIASAQRGEGNYLLTFILGATASTGSHRYGAGDAVLRPAFAFGKGWGRFDVQSTVGVNLPAGGTAKLGRQIEWNTAFQYQAFWKLWPELEVNSTFYKTGKNAGATQVFLTPGLGFGRVRLLKRLRFSSAVGMQVAATRFHTYDHRWIFSERFSF